ncbi:MAG: 3-methyl-2-oxobutanoate hydroxymethyltransferase [Verrucomicrobiota bacterium JB025]|nr:3-methyl-2-oxobutanoate hydroxymethyltransferase [Verrucomicrobiota bacterium JB025]
MRRLPRGVRGLIHSYDDLAMEVANARKLVAAGVCSIVFESVVGHTAKPLSQSLSIPIIGIGCGEGICGRKIAACADLLGCCPWIVPPFATPDLDVASATRTAVARYVSPDRETD